MLLLEIVAISLGNNTYFMFLLSHVFYLFRALSIRPYGLLFNSYERSQDTATIGLGLRTSVHPLGSYKAWILQVIVGLRCLHSPGIVHRDLRIDNLLFSPDGSRLLICDLESR